MTTKTPTYLESLAYSAPLFARPSEMNAAHPERFPDGIATPGRTAANVETYKHTAVADTLVARMRRDLPDYLSSRSIAHDIDTVLSTYGTTPEDRVRTMKVLSDAAQMRVFHDTIDALMPGSRKLERFDDPQHPERILERVSTALDSWAAMGMMMDGPEYTK